jgi:hypothetical protein
VGYKMYPAWPIKGEELHNLYSSPTIKVVKLRMMRWAGHVARMIEILS